MGGYYLASEKKPEESQVSKVLALAPSSVFMRVLIMFSDPKPYTVNPNPEP